MPNSQTGGASQKKDEPPTVQKTLNGYDMATAQAMIANFAANYTNDNNSKSVNAWYSVADLTNIYNLLMSEPQADGVRFYFGCDVPASGTTALNLSILLISTKLRSVPAGSPQSLHGDYYDHTATYLNNGIIGPSVNNAAAMSFQNGAAMYGPHLPNDAGCTNPGQHYLETPITYQWVQAHCETSATNDTSPLNTKSEWFETDFIEALFYSIIHAPVAIGFDGLRIYLGKGLDYKNMGILRDVVVLIPTQADGKGNHVDYNGCVEDLGLVSFSGQLNLNNPGAAKATKLSRGISSFNINVQAKSRLDGGGYDKGELCPYTCN